MKSLLGCWATLLVLLCPFIGPSTASAAPPRQFYGISSTGVIYQFDKLTGAATPKRTLDAVRLNCHSPNFYGLLFDNNVFYTTCLSNSGRGLIIRFAFTPGDEIVWDTITVQAQSGNYVTAFDQMYPINAAGQRLVIAVRARLQDTAFYYPLWWGYDPIGRTYGAGGGEGPSVPLCTDSNITASLFRFANPFQYTDVAAAGLVGEGITNALALGIYDYPPYPGCFQAECLLSYNPSTVTIENTVANWAYSYDTMRYDTATGEVWALSLDPTTSGGSNPNLPYLVKMRTANQQNYCTATHNGFPYINPGVDDAPRVIGSSTITGGPIVGVDFAENYFDYPFPPPPPPGVPQAQDCDFYQIKKDTVCM